MKLVELLARDLSDWPEACKTMTQDADGDVNMYEGANPKTTSSGRVWIDDGFLDYAKRSDEVADDHSTAIVTRAQWQAERDKQKGGGWKRHRGGKCPVPAGTKVSTRHRSGEVVDIHHHTAQNSSSAVTMDCVWKHLGNGNDIMAYKVISQPQAEEVEVKDTNIGTISYKISVDQIAGPLAWRDTIIHCQAIIEDCEREIERNVQLLDAEGLMMQKDSKKAMQHYAPDADMSDWRNWRVGDTVRMETKNHPTLMGVGDHGEITMIADHQTNPIHVGQFYVPHVSDLRWVSRP